MSHDIHLIAQKFQIPGRSLFWSPGYFARSNHPQTGPFLRAPPDSGPENVFSDNGPFAEVGSWSNKDFSRPPVSGDGF